MVRSGGRVEGASVDASRAGAAGDQTVLFADMYAQESRDLLVQVRGKKQRCDNACCVMCAVGKVTAS